jgi:tRNA A-37 threonylcarbamoyl transferase component Bud32
MKKKSQKTVHKGIVLFGPKAEEYGSAVHILLAGGLPPQWEWVNSSANSIVAKRLYPSNVYYKEFLSRSPLEKMKGLIRGSRCERAIGKGEILRQRGFLTPTVICWGKKGNRHFMITEGLRAISLLTHIENNWIPPLMGEELEAKRELIARLAKDIANLHSAGICHGDLKVNNLLIRQSDSELDFYFIDNERNAYFSGPAPRRFIQKNLVQLNRQLLPNVTRQDRLRFFKAYSKTYGGLSPAEERTVLVRINQETLARRAKKKRD